jgi:hypothetical protein
MSEPEIRGLDDTDLDVDISTTDTKSDSKVSERIIPDARWSLNNKTFDNIDMFKFILPVESPIAEAWTYNASREACRMHCSVFNHALAIDPDCKQMHLPGINPESFLEFMRFVHSDAAIIGKLPSAECALLADQFGSAHLVDAFKKSVEAIKLNFPNEMVRLDIKKVITTYINLGGDIDALSSEIKMGIIWRTNADDIIDTRALRSLLKTIQAIPPERFRKTPRHIDYTAFGTIVWFKTNNGNGVDYQTGELRSLSDDGMKAKVRVGYKVWEIPVNDVWCCGADPIHFAK